jgi:acetyl esterase/lipase
VNLRAVCRSSNPGQVSEYLSPMGPAIEPNTASERSCSPPFVSRPPFSLHTTQTGLPALQVRKKLPLRKKHHTANMERYTTDPTSQHPNALRVLDKFSTFRTEYKLIDGQPIHAFFIVPDNLPSGPRPLLVRFHGGGWVEGEAEASIRAL